MPEQPADEATETYDSVGELAGALVLGEAAGWWLVRVTRDDYGRLRAEYQRRSSGSPAADDAGPAGDSPDE